MDNMEEELQETEKELQWLEKGTEVNKDLKSLRVTIKKSTKLETTGMMSFMDSGWLFGWVGWVL